MAHLTLRNEVMKKEVEGSITLTNRRPFWNRETGIGGKKKTKLGPGEAIPR